MLGHRGTVLLPEEPPPRLLLHLHGVLHCDADAPVHHGQRGGGRGPHPGPVRHLRRHPVPDGDGPHPGDDLPVRHHRPGRDERPRAAVPGRGRPVGQPALRPEHGRAARDGHLEPPRDRPHLVPGERQGYEAHLHEAGALRPDRTHRPGAPGGAGRRPGEAPGTEDRQCGDRARGLPQGRGVHQGFLYPRP